MWMPFFICRISLIQQDSWMIGTGIITPWQDHYTHHVSTWQTPFSKMWEAKQDCNYFPAFSPIPSSYNMWAVGYIMHLGQMINIYISRKTLSFTSNTSSYICTDHRLCYVKNNVRLVQAMEQKETGHYNIYPQQTFHPWCVTKAA